MYGVLTTVSIVLALTCPLGLLLVLVWIGEGPDDSEPDSDDGGGGNKRREPPGPQGGGGGEPPWWPEFERDFAEYVRGEAPCTAERSRDRAATCPDKGRLGDGRRFGVGERPARGFGVSSVGADLRRPACHGGACRFGFESQAAGLLPLDESGERVGVGAAPPDADGLDGFARRVSMDRRCPL